MKTFDIKNFMTTFAAWCAGLGVFLGGLNVTVFHLPVWVTALGGAMVGFAAVINGVYGGRNNDGSTKTQAQINAQINPPPAK
jgi:hypothetical protein